MRAIVLSDQWRPEVLELNVVDDSRFRVASVAFAVTQATNVAEVLLGAMGLRSWLMRVRIVAVQTSMLSLSIGRSHRRR